MDTEEMYELGVSDAERGDPNPFYYQHYYPYRRGYDKARRRLRGPQALPGGRAGRGWLIAAIVAVLLIGGAFVALRSRAQPSVALRPSVAPTHAPATPPAARSPIFPTATPAPAPTVMHIGGMAQVSNTEGKVLRARQSPSLKAPAQAAFKEGEQVRVLEGPVTADGYTWWRIEGSGGAGWSAQQSTDGVIWLQPVEK